jgi:hypothetical protein
VALACNYERLDKVLEEIKFDNGEKTS